MTSCCVTPSCESRDDNQFYPLKNQCLRMNEPLPDGLPDKYSHVLQGWRDCPRYNAVDLMNPCWRTRAQAKVPTGPMYSPFRDNPHCVSMTQRHGIADPLYVGPRGISLGRPRSGTIASFNATCRTLTTPNNGRHAAVGSVLRAGERNSFRSCVLRYLRRNARCPAGSIHSLYDVNCTNAAVGI
eukprot:GEMP01056251.1.p1 GENE.GEMP01056251.1~~GEMP01056251.1.p1  ORF type:complete len:184 (+),score=31.06 GEMP01056251.1:101-652(+)